MREILFRGKRVDNGKWVEGGFCYGGNRNESIICPKHDFSTEVIPETVGQYTGLTDKNGKKIFEGDIVLYSWGDNNERQPFFIEFSDGEFRATPKIITQNIWSIRIASYASDFEIIGNIHDNPELMMEAEA